MLHASNQPLDKKGVKVWNQIKSVKQVKWCLTTFTNFALKMQSRWYGAGCMGQSKIYFASKMQTEWDQRRYNERPLKVLFVSPMGTTVCTVPRPLSVVLCFVAYAVFVREVAEGKNDACSTKHDTHLLYTEWRMGPREKWGWTYWAVRNKRFIQCLILNKKGEVSEWLMV